MADADDVRRIASSLPHVEEIDSDGFDFRVGNRGFVWSYPERQPGRPRRIRSDIAVLFVGDDAEKQALLLGEPDLFFTAPGYDGVPLVMLRLGEVGVERLTELVTDAWRMRASNDLAVDLPESDVAPSAAETETRHEPMQLEFAGEVWFWRGPAPWYFVTVPDEMCTALQSTSSAVSYGWGMIPVTARIGQTDWKTSLFPKDGRYVVPLKAVVRKAENVEEGETVGIRLVVDV
jgi:hypothetical protein